MPNVGSSKRSENKSYIYVSLPTYYHVLVIRQGVWIDNSIY